VTGSAGYIGSRLVHELQQQGHAVVGLDRAAHGSDGPDETIETDLLEADGLATALGGVDRVYHLAAAKGDWGLSEEEYFRDNVEATRRLVTAGRAVGVDEWVLFSTVAVLGSSDTPLSESAPMRPETAYGRTKAESEELLRELSEAVPSAKILIVRPSAVYGPGHPDSTNIYRLVEAIRADRFVMVGEGGTRKTTSHLTNLLAATRFLDARMERGVHTFIYVDEPVLTTEELVERIYTLLDKDRPALRLPLGLARTLALGFDVVARLTGVDLPITAARIEKFCRSTVFDAGKIRGRGFRQPVSNHEALRRTVEWHRARRG